MERMADLWKLEAEVRGHSPETRAAARQAVSAPIVAGLFTLWQQTLPRISGKSKLAEAIRYALTRRAIFECFLTDGLVELDSNIVERAIRPQTITRRNSLFAGSDGGGRTWATIATLLQTCKMNDVGRSGGLADADPRTHRQPMAECQDRRAHAVELQSLNGLSFPLTTFWRPAATFERSSIFGNFCCYRRAIWQNLPVEDR